MSSENVKKDECIYIGDSGSDMKAGKNAGIFSVGVLWGYRDREVLENAGAKYLAKTPNELIEILKNLMQ